jgi:hypothetical protein
VAARHINLLCTAATAASPRSRAAPNIPPGLVRARGSRPWASARLSSGDPQLPSRRLVASCRRTRSWPCAELTADRVSCRRTAGPGWRQDAATAGRGVRDLVGARPSVSWKCSVRPSRPTANALTGASTRLSLTLARTAREPRSVTGCQRPPRCPRPDPPVSAGAEVVDLGDRVVRPPHRPEPVGDGLEVRLEDGFQHQLQRCLDHLVGHGGDAELPQLLRPARLGDQPLAHWQGPESARLQLGPQVIQEPRDTDALLHQRDGQAVHAGGVRAPVPRDPVKRHDQRRRVTHEVWTAPHGAELQSVRPGGGCQ